MEEQHARRHQALPAHLRGVTISPGGDHHFPDQNMDGGAHGSPRSESPVTQDSFQSGWDIRDRWEEDTEMLQQDNNRLRSEQKALLEALDQLRL